MIFESPWKNLTDTANASALKEIKMVSVETLETILMKTHLADVPYSLRLPAMIS